MNELMGALLIACRWKAESKMWSWRAAGIGALMTEVVAAANELNANPGPVASLQWEATRKKVRAFYDEDIERYPGE